jgi:ubiquitin-conjugating enzyme E2 D/E
MIKFRTKIYHPNISETGSICLDILKNKWNSVQGISKVLLSISSLLDDPNPHDPLVADIARVMNEDPRQFQETAREWTLKFADQ